MFDYNKFELIFDETTDQEIIDLYKVYPELADGKNY